MVEPTDSPENTHIQEQPPEPAPRVYGWPENEIVRACHSAQTLEQWLHHCQPSQDVIGSVASELVELGLSNEIPPHDEIERLISHPWIKDATMRLRNEVFTSVTGKSIKETNRALVLLGARAMRDIALCAALTERALVQPMPQVMLPEIVRSYLSGVFALLIARKKYQIANTSHLLTACK